MNFHPITQWRTRRLARRMDDVRLLTFWQTLGADVRASLAADIDETNLLGESK